MIFTIKNKTINNVINLAGENKIIIKVVISL